MRIEVNGEVRELESAMTLTELLTAMKIGLDGTAVAVDDNIVPKSTFNDFVLKDNMRVDIFNLVAGG